MEWGGVERPELRSRGLCNVAALCPGSSAVASFHEVSINDLIPSNLSIKWETCLDDGFYQTVVKSNDYLKFSFIMLGAPTVQDDPNFDH